MSHSPSSQHSPSQQSPKFFRQRSESDGDQGAGAFFDSRLGIEGNLNVPTTEALDDYYIKFKRQILQYQSPTSGLFPSIGNAHNPSRIGHVRDSIYCAVATWAMHLAYRRIDDDHGRAHELSQSCVKCMRGILYCWLRQADRVENFKQNQSTKSALHSVFDMFTGEAILKDEDYDHLQPGNYLRELREDGTVIEPEEKPELDEEVEDGKLSEGSEGLNQERTPSILTEIETVPGDVDCGSEWGEDGEEKDQYSSDSLEESRPPTPVHIPAHEPGRSVSLMLEMREHLAGFDTLAIDVVALYLLMLSQMTYSGLQVIYSTDEVNFIQNLVFYVERAYRTPDYGMWERGSKYNNGMTELHASSIGMAKAALEAVNGCNLFGEQGAAWSVVFVDIDAHNRNRTIFESILPRESSSKNTDTSLLPTLCWPAFSLHENPIKDRAVDKVIRRLKGKYGMKRFLRDGYKTVMEDRSRKYYRPAEVKNFDGIECEWPMFLLYLIIDCHFRNDKENIKKYMAELEDLLYYSEDGKLVPMYYYVTKDQIEMERAQPGSQQRAASPEGTTGGVFLWGQALFIITQLLNDELVLVNELDVIRRYLPALERPKFSTRYSKFQGTAPDLVIQVVLIAESVRLQQLLGTYGIQTQTPHQVEPIQIWSPKELTKAYCNLGVNNKLRLTGRPSRPFGVLSTSKIYRACGQSFICYPLLFELSDFYLAQDISLVMDDCKNDLAFLSKCWKLHGRPTWCMIIRENAIRGQNFSNFLGLLAQFKKGDMDGIHIRLGKLQSFNASACVEHLDFLHHMPDSEMFQPFTEKVTSSGFRSLTDIPTTEQKLASTDDFHVELKELENKPNHELLSLLKQFDGVTNQAFILRILFTREGAGFRIDGDPIVERMEMVINRAGVHKKWEIVRLLAATLGKLVDSLAPSITTILVRGKQITVGVFSHEEEVLDKPVTPSELKMILYRMCSPYDIRQAVLQQELIIAIGKLIAFSPQLFDGILKIRIGWIVQAMIVELHQDAGHFVDIHTLSPYDLKEQLLRVLTRNAKEADLRTPFQKRQLDGALNRVPKDFYDRVWKILEKTPGGIKVSGYQLPQQPTQSDMTMYEMNFSLLVEQMLSKIVEPAYRQLVVEAVMVVSTILARNPEFTFQQCVHMDKIIAEAYEEFKKDKQLTNCSKEEIVHRFFNTPPNIRHGTTSYIGKAVINNLLDGDIHTMAGDIVDSFMNEILKRDKRSSHTSKHHTSPHKHHS